jgi:hypothetical protein
MGRFLLNPAVKNQMTPCGLGQTVANYFYFVNSTGCLYNCLAMFMLSSWDAGAERAQISLAAAILFGMWAFQKFMGCLV